MSPLEVQNLATSPFAERNRKSSELPKLSIKSPSDAHGSELGQGRGRNKDFVSKSTVAKKSSNQSYTGYTGQDRRFLDAIKKLKQTRMNEIMGHVNAENGMVLYQSEDKTVNSMPSEQLLTLAESHDSGRGSPVY